MKRFLFAAVIACLTQGLQYEMRLSGTYKVLEMTRTKLVIQKESMGVRTVYSFRRFR